MKLILHIGQHKTGTTALQDALFADRSRLENAGILYPLAGRDHRPDGSPRNDHNGLFFSMEPNSARPGLRPLGAIGAALLAEMEHTQPERLVMSAEHAFLAADRPEAAPLAKLDEVVPGHRRIVVYLRRPDRYLESWDRQAVRLGMAKQRPLHQPKRIRRLMKTCRLDYVRAIELYRQRYGNVQVFNYETIADTVAHFYREVLELEPPGIPQRRANTSIPAVFADLARTHLRNHGPLSPAQLRALVRYGEQEPVDLLGPANRARIFEFFAPQDEALGALVGAESFFPDLEEMLQPSPGALTVDEANERYQGDFEALVGGRTLRLRLRRLLGLF